jgi:hypothetical protein
MTKKICPEKSCNKEFEIPVLVNNFIFTPKKETYYACPYCLTKIKDKIESSICEKPIIEKKIEIKNEYKKKEIEPFIATKKMSHETVYPIASIEEIQNLEKEKMDLLEELDLLKQNAENRIELLKEELLDLKIEREKLRKIIKG